jgi:hypothetical protein
MTGVGERKRKKWRRSEMRRRRWRRGVWMREERKRI